MLAKWITLRLKSLRTPAHGWAVHPSLTSSDFYTLSSSKKLNHLYLCEWNAIFIYLFFQVGHYSHRFHGHEMPARRPELHLQR